MKDADPEWGHSHFSASRSEVRLIGRFGIRGGLKGFNKTRRGIEQRNGQSPAAAAAVLLNQIQAFDEAWFHLHMKHVRIMAVFRSSFLILLSSVAASHQLGTSSEEEQHVCLRVDKPSVTTA